MTARPEALFLAHRIPYPPNKGDKIRSWRLLQFLAAHFDVHLAAFVDDPEDFHHRGKLLEVAKSVTLEAIDPRIGRIKSLHGLIGNRPLSIEFYRSASFKQAVAQIRARPLAAEIVFSSTMAQYIATPIGDRVRIVDFCDADSEKWAQYAQEATFPMRMIYAREGRFLRAAENEIANWADASFAISPEEASIFNTREGITKTVDWFANGVDTDYFNPSLVKPVATHETDVVFSGAMDYRANIDAVAYFVGDIWPLVRAKKPDATFTVVGANPAKTVRAVDGSNGVRVTGRVDDIRPWIAGGKVAVAPLRIARGVQNKVLEGMAMARPVVATPDAAAGIHVADDTLVIESDATAMAEKIVALLGDAPRRRAIGAAARAHIVRTYQWRDQFAPLARALGVKDYYSSSSIATAS